MSAKVSDRPVINCIFPICFTLFSRVMTVRGESTNLLFNVEQAAQARDALSKALFSRIFDMLVEVRWLGTVTIGGDKKYH